ncbi:MAG TPA: 5-oxoprolinase subunit PxpA [Candidatus Polarisedimenticolaceae bacterium]|nr:5-oxoprolinase subunit PxpA [Candidatus Polarisedimenticolaceae bacterium]
MTIDLNADVGEIEGEEPLYALATSVNVACGGHAGDEASMTRAIRLAASRGVAVGAHPGYPDRAHFGRRSVHLSRAELTAALAVQIEALSRLCRVHGVPLVHVKPHGALYHDASRDERVAQAIADAAPGAVLVGLAGSLALTRYAALGRRTAAEGFADRTYEPDGSLRPREKPGALLLDPARAAAQAVRLARSGTIATVCVHADTPGAAGILARVREALEEVGIRPAAPRHASR